MQKIAPYISLKNIWFSNFTEPDVFNINLTRFLVYFLCATFSGSRKILKNNEPIVIVIAKPIHKTIIF